MNNKIELFKILSDETRVRILNLIYHHKLCVCELVEVLGLSQPKISKHIAKLRQMKLVNTERNEQYVYYSLNKENKNFEKIISTVIEFIKEEEQIKYDIEKLNSIESFVCMGN